MKHYFDIDTSDFRKAEYDIEDVFVRRWSPRAMNGEPLDHDSIKKVLEAGRWAPSSYNSQPWRFIVGIHGEQTFDRILDHLVEFNQSWAKNAGALIAVVSNKHHEDGSQYRTSSFDTGSAWMNIALQARHDDLITHGMAGVDYGGLRDEFEIADDMRIEMVFALGEPGRISDLPEDLQEQEKPSGRKELDDLILVSD